MAATINLQRLFDQRTQDESLPFLIDGVWQSHPSDLGFTGWNYDPQLSAANGATPTSGTLQLAKFLARAPVVFSTVYVAMTAAGSTLTSGQNFLSVFSSSGARLYNSADQSSTWAGSTGWLPYAIGRTTLAQDDFLYVGILSNGSSTPAFLRAAATVALSHTGNLAASAYWAATNGTSLTAMPSSLTPANNAQTGSLVCVAVS